MSPRGAGANPRVLAHVQGLVGGRVRPPTRTRGVYSVWPNSRHRDLPEEAVGESLGPHNDGSAQVLNGMAYLDTVGHRGGGFTIWPGAHRLLYYAYGHQVNPGRDPELYGALMAQVKATITPLEICAPRGSVVFWHGRMAHSAGIHRGGPGTGPRFAVPTDWCACFPRQSFPRTHTEKVPRGAGSGTTTRCSLGRRRRACRWRCSLCVSSVCLCVSLCASSLCLLSVSHCVSLCQWFKDAPVYVGDSLGPPKTDMFADWGLTPEAVETLVSDEVEAEFEE